MVLCSGIDARIWEQAKLDNPDPRRMIPVPIVGFDELHQRLRLQEQQTSLHRARLDVSDSNNAVVWLTGKTSRLTLWERLPY